MEMINLQNLYTSLMSKDKHQYTVIDTPDGIWDLKGAKKACLIEFTKTLAVYHDNKRGYEILSRSRFSPEQLVPIETN